MVRALGIRKDGKISLIFGLSEKDVDRLKVGKSIIASLEDIPFPEGNNNQQLVITLIYGADEDEIRKGFELLMHTENGNN